MREEMKFEPFFGDRGKRAFWIAGPCSAETEEQMLETAKGLASSNIDLFRAGIWKPRTRPNSFEGIGTQGLEWLSTVKRETGLKVCTEVANVRHVEEALKHNIDVLWIGARTTVNPFSVQEIADALKGTDIPILIKNPINPDIKLWIGAIERIYDSGIKQLGVIHRGFSSYGSDKYRNQPRWQIAIELKRQFPNLPMICDSSHICGTRDLLEEVSQKALDLNYDGIMLEVHPDPDKAWSDPKQQIQPNEFSAMKDRLKYRQVFTDNAEFLESLENFRHQIDEIDEEIMSLMASRMNLAAGIGAYKKQNNISILQTGRWSEILDKNIAKGNQMGLSAEFVSGLLKAVHQESINRQHQIMKNNED
ncbi:MAG TPA: chorismate mutase [Cryomorphaceae bacterium]|nr:chorismate mutase [Cryomorphaceae bacterium]